MDRWVTMQCDKFCDSYMQLLYGHRKVRKDFLGKFLLSGVLILSKVVEGNEEKIFWEEGR